MSHRRDIHLLLADADGPLVTPDDVLTEAAKAATRALHQAGIALAITSGRPPREMHTLFEPLALPHPTPPHPTPPPAATAASSSSLIFP